MRRLRVPLSLHSDRLKYQAEMADKISLQGKDIVKVCLLIIRGTPSSRS
jgi:hypothetical protein